MAYFDYPITCLRGTWSFILGSLRLILFAAALLYLAVHLIIAGSLIFLSKSLLSSDLQGHVGFLDYLTVLGLVVVAGLGVYGSFYKHINSIRAFALLTSLIGLYFLLGAAISPAPSREMDQLFNESVRHYDWNAKPNKLSGVDPNQTNAYVDGLQFIGCCGYNNLKDWRHYRPSDVHPDALPVSCCGSISPLVVPRECSILDQRVITRPGCKELLGVMANAALIMSIFYGLYQIFMALIAFIVSFCNLVEFQKSPSSNDWA